MKRISPIIFIVTLQCTLGKCMNIRRKLDENVESCGIIGFSIFNSASNSTIPIGENDPFDPDRFRARVLLDTFPSRRINIVANMAGQSCDIATPIRCVKMKLGNFWQRTDRVAPYSLYGNDIINGGLSVRKPTQTGWQDLEAWTYTNGNCTHGESGYAKISLHLVPNTVQTILSGPLIAEHVGTTATTTPSVSINVYTEVANIACDFIQDALGYGFLYKGSLELIDFNCMGTKVVLTAASPATTTSPPPLQIKYRIAATFQISTDLSWYLNQDMPTISELNGFISRILLSEITQGPFAEDYLLDVIKSQITSNNPFYNTTAIILR
jgi:hypothetical protein